tara:strand:- start:38408 stop:39178 length:771 start_codon:yes stop_codon:yes gene_type:complete
MFLPLLFSSSCHRADLFAFEGNVYNKDKEAVVQARIQIFKTPQDWLTGHNVLATMSSDLIGHYKSPKIFEEGDYYIFIDKYDTSNWELSQVEKGEYPKIHLPTDGDINQTIEHNNMSLLANTNWKLVNILQEYSKPGEPAVQWLSIWSTTNNCEKDNKLLFGKDLSLRVDEGKSVCSGEQSLVVAKFVPPLIFSTQSCDKLPHTSQLVKPFEFSNWPSMETANAQMFLACDQSIGQLYIIYDSTQGYKLLKVYRRL